MNTQEFTYLLNSPKDINKAHTDELEDIINTFPYFQSARAIYLKGLKNQDSFRYNQTLKTTAAYTADRSILFDFITSSQFFDKKTIANDSEQVILEEIEVIDAEVVKSLHQKIKNTFSPKKNKQNTEILEIGKPLEFESSESHSFNEWLQLGTFTPIKREEKKDNREVKFDLIDKFIAKNPKIRPVKNIDSNSTLIEHNKADYDSLMTETLAKVYLEQKKYENAIKAYRILSLKYPEKSSFFADRIKAIKLLDKK
ncbi:hypothetical protein [Urechidicola croceus]|uniref:Tetratricopeptide repeat protein n=1 Tax=Urechidicola croceus TaxID=1850246 RepID=A0A1D8PAV5_9FLAO|nr:hypothetical protein [Urechidicola croceus]AOW21671.1 hypothetical protein LPB138_13715 [Urechidicola croceus]